MQFVDHKIAAFWKERSPHSSGTLVNPSVLVIHYTGSGGGDGAGDVGWFKDPNSKVSAHFIVGRGGDISQVVETNRKAWHAGKSIWRGRSNVNDFSIGIEVDNWGILTPTTGGKFLNGYGRVVDGVVAGQAVHKNGGPKVWWEAYNEVQIKALIELIEAIQKAYPSIKEIVGHDDIAPGRKTDPGPLFPWAKVRAATEGRGDVEEEIRSVITAVLNVREGASTVSGVVGKLYSGDKVRVLYDAGQWSQVQAVDRDNLRGWVFDQYLQ